MIEYQPFAHIKYPQKQYKKALQPDQEKSIPIMSEDEYQVIMEALEKKAETSGNRVYDRASKESAKRLIPVIHFLATYGLRIGDMLSVRLEEGDRFSYIQKGGEVRQRALKPITHEMLEKYGMLKRQSFEDLVKVTVQGALRKLTKKLSVRGVIRCAYSCYDFRHLYAVSLYQNTKDVYAVKEALRHSTVSVTEIYLVGLGALGK
jgi:integrase